MGLVEAQLQTAKLELPSAAEMQLPGGSVYGRLFLAREHEECPLPDVKLNPEMPMNIQCSCRSPKNLRGGSRPRAPGAQSRTQFRLRDASFPFTAQMTR